MKRDDSELLAFFFVIFAPVGIFHILFNEPAYKESLEIWSAGDLLTYFGTMVLSMIAILQNRKLTDIEKRMLSLEENKRIPSMALFSLENHKLEEYDVGHTLLCCVEAKGMHFTLKNDGTIGSNCPKVYFFRLKNVTEADIISIIPKGIYVFFYDEARGSFTKRRKLPYDIWMTDRSIQGRESIPFILGTPELLSEQRKRNGDRLYLMFDFLLQSTDGTWYCQSITLCVAGNMQDSFISPTIISQIIDKPRKEKRET